MSDPDPRLREALDRRAARFAPSGNLDRLLARARRRHRNRRLAAGVVALSVFARVAGGQWLLARGRAPPPAPGAPGGGGPRGRPGAAGAACGSSPAAAIPAQSLPPPRRSRP
jgi:hypothetical protein